MMEVEVDDGGGWGWRWRPKMMMMMMEVGDNEEKKSTWHVSVEFEILCPQLHVPCLLLFSSIFLPLSSLFHRQLQPPSPPPSSSTSITIPL